MPGPVLPLPLFVCRTHFGGCVGPSTVVGPDSGLACSLAPNSSSGRKTRTLRHCLPTATTDNPSDGLELDGGSGSGNWPGRTARGTATKRRDRGGVENLCPRPPPLSFRAAVLLPSFLFPSFFLAAIIFPIVVNLSASWCFHLISHCNGLFFLERTKGRTEAANLREGSFKWRI